MSTSNEPITLNTAFWLTPAGSAALDAFQRRRLTRKRRLIPALAAKRIRRNSPAAR